MKVLLLGATGLIGRHVLEGLLAAPQVTELVVPTRRALSGADSGLNANTRLHNAVIDFDRLDQYPELFDVTTIVCCLGTTMKQAGSKENFRKVDFQYCRDAAELGRAQRARAFLLVSAIGSSPSSPFYYSRVKGELEQHLIELEYNHLSLYRPSMLLGERDEFRLGEKLYSKLTPLVDPFMRGPLRHYHAIPARTVAQAMVNECLSLGEVIPPGPRVSVYPYDKIAKLAGSR